MPTLAEDIRFSVNKKVIRLSAPDTTIFNVLSSSLLDCTKSINDTIDPDCKIYPFTLVKYLPSLHIACGYCGIFFPFILTVVPSK